MNKIKILFFSAFFSFLLFSCKSVSQEQSSQTNKIVKTAEKYLGTRYKYGGTSKYGMDCSGLVYTTFLENKIKLPRTSFEMSKLGKSVSFNNLNEGDLLFFKNPNSRRIDHVGIVTSGKNGDFQFIHSSTSKGVILSSIKESYWKKTFVKGKRVLKVSTSITQNTKYHKVKTGDTLYGISKKYNTSVQNIKKLNNLTENTISLGTSLRVL